MKKIIPFLLVGIPLCLSAIFITNTVESQTFPLLRNDTLTEQKNIEQTYQAGLGYCEKSFEHTSISENNKLKECIESVEKWYMENNQN
jgi:hypothetical protein